MINYLRKWALVFGKTVFICCFLLVLVTNTRFSQSVYTVTDKIKSTNENLPKHARQCVSFYDLLEEGIAKQIGKKRSKRSSLSLIGAYAYPNYSVVTSEADGWFGQRVYCHYFDVNWNKLSSPVESVVYPEHAVHCCRHPEAVYMGITESEDEEVVFTVPVLDRTVDKPKYNLSVCLAPIYGDENKWLLLAELIEHYKLQGVQHLYIYVKSVDDYSRLIIDDYEKSGEVEVVYFRKEQDRLDMEWHIVGVEDCLQRSRHHSRYAIFVDLDERLMALGNQTLADFIPKAMTEKENIGMLQFRMRWVLRTAEPPDRYEVKAVSILALKVKITRVRGSMYRRYGLKGRQKDEELLKEWSTSWGSRLQRVGTVSKNRKLASTFTIGIGVTKGEVTLKKHLPTLVFHNTSAVAPHNHIPKCAIDPRRAVTMWIHHVKLYFPGYSYIRVSPDKAIISFVLHYRILIDTFNTTKVPSIMSRIRTARGFGNFTMTDYPEHLMRKLYVNVKKRLSRVYGKA